VQSEMDSGKTLAYLLPIGGLGRGHRGVPERAGVGDGDERAGGDGEEGAQRVRQRWGVGVSGGSIVFISVVVK
jgi:hypothetical protein